MKGFIIAVVALAVAFAFKQGLEVFKAKSDFAEKVDHQRAFVSETSMDSVKQDVIADAKKLGIDVTPDNIAIKYEDTEQQSVAQSVVGKLGMQYTNKRVTISVDYTAHILGIPLHENVTQTGIRQVEAPRKTVSPEMQQLLDGNPQ